LTCFDECRVAVSQVYRSGVTYFDFLNLHLLEEGPTVFHQNRRFARPTVFAVKSPKVTQISVSGNRVTYSTGYVSVPFIMYSVPYYALHLIAEGLMVCPFCGSFYGRPVIGQIFSSCGFFFFLLLLLLFSSPNLSGRRLDVYHTSTHGVALV